MKNVLKLLCLSIFVLASCLDSFAASLACKNYAVSKKLYYWSVDANNNPIRLSEMVNYNSVYKDIKFVMINNHPTTTSNALVPTGSEPQIAQVYYMCDGTDKCMVVSPDYLGYGDDTASSDGVDSYQSRNTTHPYMCPTLTARNIVDGVIAAMEYIVTQKNTIDYTFRVYTSENYTFASDYYTLNVGYSQGGATALAVQKYLETEASQEVQDKIKLKKSICGAGPHLQTYMFEHMSEQSSLEYPVYLPYIIDGMKYTFADDCLRDLSDKEIYTDEFLNTDILDKMRDKNMEAADINKYIKEQFGGSVNFYNIIRSDYKDPATKLYRGLHKALTQCDLLEGWVPTHPITFYHWQKDEVVPYAESEKAYNYFKNNGANVELLQPSQVKLTSPWNGAKILSYFSDKLKMDDTHMGYGTRFYLSIFSGTLR